MMLLRSASGISVSSVTKAPRDCVSVGPQRYRIAAGIATGPGKRASSLRGLAEKAPVRHYGSPSRSGADVRWNPATEEATHGREGSPRHRLEAQELHP